MRFPCFQSRPFSVRLEKQDFLSRVIFQIHEVCMMLCSFMGCWALEEAKPGGDQSTHLATEAEVSSPLNQGAPGAHISLVPGQPTKPLCQQGQTAPAFPEKLIIITVLMPKNCFYLLNLISVDVALPTSMISSFLTAALGWAPTSCPLPHVTTVVPTSPSPGFHLHQCTDFCSTMLNWQQLRPHVGSSQMFQTGPEDFWVFGVQWSWRRGRGTS